MMDEDENEDMEEEELDIAGDLVEEIDEECSPWDMYADNMDPDGDIDDTTEDTALLRSRAAKTEIIVTPISPVSPLSSFNFQRQYCNCVWSASSQVNSSQNLARMVAEANTSEANALHGAYGQGGSSMGQGASRSMDLLRPDMAQRQRLLDDTWFVASNIMILISINIVMLRGCHHHIGQTPPAQHDGCSAQEQQQQQRDRPRRLVQVSTLVIVTFNAATKKTLESNIILTVIITLSNYL